MRLKSFVLGCLTVVLAVGTAREVAAQLSGTFVPIQVPGASLTIARAITADGRIVGIFNNASGQHGFLLVDGQFSTIDAPEAIGTAAFGINSRGDVVGGWVDKENKQRGFVWPASGSFTSIEIPGAIRTIARGINAAGDIVGVYDMPDKRRGFLRTRSGEIRLIDLPGTMGPPVNGTWAASINERGDIVGPGFDGSIHGYLMSGDTVTQIDVDFPGAMNSQAYGLNTRGDIVGYYMIGTKAIGFLRDRHGNEESIEAPVPDPAVNTMAWGINARGDIVGQYVLGGVFRGFVLYRASRP
jgi:probable HAF family extracellular repeat protein